MPSNPLSWLLLLLLLPPPTVLSLLRAIVEKEMQAGLPVGTFGALRQDGAVVESCHRALKELSIIRDASQTETLRETDLFNIGWNAMFALHDIASESAAQPPTGSSCPNRTAMRALTVGASFAVPLPATTFGACGKTEMLSSLRRAHHSSSFVGTQLQTVSL